MCRRRKPAVRRATLVLSGTIRPSVAMPVANPKLQSAAVFVQAYCLAAMLTNEGRPAKDGEEKERGNDDLQGGSPGEVQHGHDLEELLRVIGQEVGDAAIGGALAIAGGELEGLAVHNVHNKRTKALADSKCRVQVLVVQQCRGHLCAKQR